MHSAQGVLEKSGWLELLQLLPTPYTMQPEFAFANYLSVSKICLLLVKARLRCNVRRIKKKCGTARLKSRIGNAKARESLECSFDLQRDT
jgi:hypothetical protein